MEEDNVVGGTDILSAKVRSAANLSATESVLFCIVGLNRQAIIALDTQMLIVKTGFLAGATGGARRTKFQYTDITNVEVNTGWIKGVIEVLSPAYSGGTQKDFWNAGENTDPYRASNTVPFSKKSLSKFQPYLDQLDDLISQAKSPSQPQLATEVSNSKTLPEQIRELHDLFNDGAVTQEEFESAKRKLLK